MTDQKHHNVRLKLAACDKDWKATSSMCRFLDRHFCWLQIYTRKQTSLAHSDQVCTPAVAMTSCAGGRWLSMLRVAAARSTTTWCACRKSGGKHRLSAHQFVNIDIGLQEHSSYSLACV